MNTTYSFSRDSTLNSLSTNKISVKQEIYKGIITTPIHVTESGIYGLDKTFPITVTLPSTPRSNYFKFVIVDNPGSQTIFSTGHPNIKMIGTYQLDGGSVNQIDPSSTEIKSTTLAKIGDVIEFQGLGERWVVSAISSSSQGFSTI